MAVSGRIVAGEPRPPPRLAFPPLINWGVGAAARLVFAGGASRNPDRQSQIRSQCATPFNHQHIGRKIVRLRAALARAPIVREKLQQAGRRCGLRQCIRIHQRAPVGETWRRSLATHVTSRCCRCRHVRPNSTPKKTSGSSCVRTGLRTASSKATTTSSITAATPGTPSSISPGKSCLCPPRLGCRRSLAVRIGINGQRWLFLTGIDRSETAVTRQPITVEFHEGAHRGDSSYWVNAADELTNFHCLCCRRASCLIDLRMPIKIAADLRLPALVPN